MKKHELLIEEHSLEPEKASVGDYLIALKTNPNKIFVQIKIK